MASSPRIEELRKKFEENPRRYFAPLANEYRKAGDVQQAIAICREYLPQQPGHMSGHIVFGQALYEARNFEEAKAVFETALSLDPENLIALRHLGDISLILNDSEGARTWYKRVLEADPRNEEIQAQLATIEKASAPPAPAAEEPPPPPPPPAAADASTAATVVIQAHRIPEDKPVTPTSPTAEINLDAILPPTPSTPPTEARAPEVALPDPVVPAPAPESVATHEPPPGTGGLDGLEATSAGAGEPPIGSFSLDGLETTSMSGESAPPPAPLAGLDTGLAAEPPAFPAATPLPDLDFGATAPGGESPPQPGASPAPELDVAPPPVSLSSATTVELPKREASTPAPPTLDLDLSAMSPPPPPAPAPEAAAPPASPGGSAPLDLELSIPAPTLAPPPGPEPGLPGAPKPEPESREEQPAITPSDPFVTETMAELYVQQGHLEEAERVYQALLAQRPGDAGLQAKLDQLRAPAQPAAQEASGPTIRELLAAIAARRPGHRPPWPADSRHEQPSEAMGVAQSPVPAPTPSVGGNEPPRPDALSGALAFADPERLDETAATVLSRAFTRNGDAIGATALAGEPARAAKDELSLRTVFNEPAPPPSSFSFEQFFAQRPPSDVAGAAPQGQSIESPEEVAHFTAWLEGLKKR